MIEVLCKLSQYEIVTELGPNFRSSLTDVDTGTETLLLEAWKKCGHLKIMIILGYVDMIKVMMRDDNRRPCIQNHKKCVAIQDGMQVLYLERADHHHHRHSYPRHHYVHHHHPHHHHDYGLDTWQVKMELRSDLLRGPIWIWFETLCEESAWYVLSTNLDMMMLMVLLLVMMLMVVMLLVMMMISRN